MSIATIRTRALQALDAPPVTVEVHLSNGLPAFTLVGLPETGVREARDRVRSALLNSHFDFPLQRITVNLAPADLPKEGGRFDVAIALGILEASGQIPPDSTAHYEFLGELGLTGNIRPVRGALVSAVQAAGCSRKILLPAENGPEAALAIPDDHLTAEHLLDIVAHLHGKKQLTPHTAPQEQLPNYPVDCSDIKGQHKAKRALEIAAAGGHNLLLCGSPGCGKSMLAAGFPGILPAMTKEQALAQLAIQSVNRSRPDSSRFRQRPFRAPHHSASTPAIVGGGNPPRPGEISLAHEGVLFLDELPEFQRQTLEALREPLENRQISIARAGYQSVFPANFQLIAAMNPCPCGYLNDKVHPCTCTPQQVQRYRQKISGPLLDRIDLHLNLEPTPLHLLTRQSETPEESSGTIRRRVESAYNKQLDRQEMTNAALPSGSITQSGLFSSEGLEQLERSGEKLGLSARSLQRVAKVARTIADLANKDQADKRDVHEALGYRHQGTPSGQIPPTAQRQKTVHI